MQYSFPREWDDIEHKELTEACRRMSDRLSENKKLEKGSWQIYFFERHTFSALAYFYLMAAMFFIECVMKAGLRRTVQVDLVQQGQRPTWFTMYDSVQKNLVHRSQQGNNLCCHFSLSLQIFLKKLQQYLRYNYQNNKCKQ